jgi:hypothetical protein
MTGTVITGTVTTPTRGPTRGPTRRAITIHSARGSLHLSESLFLCLAGTQRSKKG